MSIEDLALIRVPAAAMTNDDFLGVGDQFRGHDYVIVSLGPSDEQLATSSERRTKLARELGKEYVQWLREVPAPREIIVLPDVAAPNRSSKHYGMQRAIWVKQGAVVLPDLLDEMRAESPTTEFEEAEITIAIPTGGRRVGFELVARGRRAGVQKIDVPGATLSALVTHYTDELKRLSMKVKVTRSTKWIAVEALQIDGHRDHVRVQVIGRWKSGVCEIGVLWIEHGLPVAGDVR